MPWWYGVSTRDAVGCAVFSRREPASGNEIGVVDSRWDEPQTAPALSDPTDWVQLQLGGKRRPQVDREEGTVSFYVVKLRRTEINADLKTECSFLDRSGCCLGPRGGWVVTARQERASTAGGVFLAVPANSSSPFTSVTREQRLAQLSSPR